MGATDAYTPVEKLLDLVLFRAAGADRVRFGTPPELEAPEAPPVPAVALWFRKNQKWEFFQYLPAALALSLLECLDGRGCGREGQALEVGAEGEPRVVRVRLGMEPGGAWFLDLAH